MFEKLLHFVGPKIGNKVVKAKGLSPEIYLLGGIALGIGAVVTIARAHKKSDYLVMDHYMAKEELEEEFDRMEEEEDIVVDENTRRGAMVPLYARSAIKAVKLYGPGVAMGVGSIGLVLASHGVMKGRTRTLISTVALLESGWASYRSRVIEELGSEADERFYYGADVRKTTVLEQGEDGKKAKKRKEEKNHIPEEIPSDIYVRVFDETNVNWSNEDGLNRLFIQSVQSLMDARLHLQGYVLLNEVYKALGFAETDYGAVVGWSKSMRGDDYVSLGLDKDINNREGETRWIIDPNVNGVMYHLIGA